MKKIKKRYFNFFKKYWTRMGGVFLFVLFFSAYINIFAIGQPYTTGETLDPDCIPGEINCTVSIGNASSVTNGVYTNSANSFSTINPLITLSESWIGPSSVSGIYFKSGNVGIGTTTPSSKLSINGGLHVGGNSDAGDKNILADGTITGTQLISTISTGTAPLSILSSTLVNNLNADLLDGHDSSYFQIALTNPITGTATNGQVAFWNSTNTQAGDNGFFWDNTNKRLGINNTSPGVSLEVSGIIKGNSLSLGNATLGTNTLAVGADVNTPTLGGEMITNGNFNGNLTGWTSTGWTYTPGGSNSVTISIGSPTVFSLNSHGLSIGDAIMFVTTGSLPTGMVKDYTYYVISEGYGPNSFEISKVPSGSALSTSGTQSGTHTLNIAGAKHTTGNTNALSQSVTVNNDGNKTYYVVVKASSASAGTLTLSATGSEGSTLIHNGNDQTGDNYYSFVYPVASGSTSTITLTPTTDWNGTVYYVSMKLINGYTTPAFSIGIPGKVNDLPFIVPNLPDGVIYDHPSNWDSQSIGIGYRALMRSVSGFQNNILGVQAGQNMTTGQHNNGFGQGALLATTTGSENSAFGHASLQYNTVGNHNSALGHYSMYWNGTGNYNVAVGDSALFANTTGSNNVAVGYKALYSNTTASTNTAIGYFSSNLLSGANNTSLGYSALQRATTATETIAIGYNALAAGTLTGAGNIGIGSSAITNATSGAQNIGIGYLALQNLTTGGSNIAIGRLAGYRINISGALNGNNNVLIGDASGSNITSGQNNTAIGNSTLSTLTTFSGNTALGNGALSSTNDAKNTGIGQSALGAHTTGDFNTALGNAAGNLDSTHRDLTGTYNTYLGANSAPVGASAAFTYLTVIGADAQGSQSNSIILGRITDSVGIGTTAPSTKLEIGSLDLGNGVAGPIITLGRNTNATNSGAGSINFLSKNGTAGHVWQDVAGNMRISTSAPSTSNDVTGTVIGTQTSTRETKQDINDYTDYTNALNMIVNAPLHTFKYIKEVEGYGIDSPLAKTRIGYIADEVDPMFMWGNTIDQVSVNGLLIASIKELNLNFQLISGNVTPIPESSSGSFVKAFFDNLYKKINIWFADINNGISSMYADVFNAKERICVDGECLNKNDIRNLLHLVNSTNQYNDSSSVLVSEDEKINSETKEADNKDSEIKIEEKDVKKLDNMVEESKESSINENQNESI